MKKELSAKQLLALLNVLQAPFEKNMERHKGIERSLVQITDMKKYSSITMALSLIMPHGRFVHRSESDFI